MPTYILLVESKKGEKEEAEKRAARFEEKNNERNDKIFRVNF